MSLPSNSPPARSSGATSREERPRRWSARLLLLLFAFALIGPCAATQGPREVGRWQLATAIKLWNEGHKEEAYDRLESAMRWLPDSPMLLLQRADFYLQDGKQREALDDANRAVELAGDNVSVLMWRAHVLQTLGQHAKAIEDWRKIAHQSEMTGNPDPSQAYNGLAYAQAVGGLELDAGLENIEKALRALSDEPLENRASLIDTRGFLLYRKGAYEAALSDLNVAVKGMENAARIADDQVIAPFSSALSADRGVAVVRYHRALVLMALGRESEAEQDLARVREIIGKEPDDTLF